MAWFIEDWEEFLEQTRKLSFTDFFSPEIKYRYKGRWISREKAYELLERGEEVREEYYFRAKKTLRDFDIHGGALYKITDDRLYSVKNWIREENTIRGIMRARLVSRETAENLYRSAKEYYEQTGDRSLFDQLSP